MRDVYYRDRDSDILGWGLVILAIVIIAAAAMFVVASNTRNDIDTTYESAPPAPITQDVAPAPIVIDRPVPVPVESTNTIIREVPVAAPDSNAGSGTQSTVTPVEESPAQ